MFADKLNKQLLTHFPPDLIGRDLLYPDISKRLNAVLRSQRGKARITKSQIIADNEKIRQTFDVLGWAEDDRIFINILVSPKREYMTFTNSIYRNFVFQVSMAVQHELVHRNQISRYHKAFLRRIPVTYKSSISHERIQNIEYYSEWREIDAYAHDIAMEINYFFPSLDKLWVVRHIDRHSRKLAHYRRYRDTFVGTEWSEVRKLLIKKIVRWLPLAKPPLDK